MSQTIQAVIDWERFGQARTHLGVRFLRVVGYFRDDGAKSVATIEDSLRAGDAIGMIGPADLLKADALQIGALSVAELAEDVEFAARDCVEWRQSPEVLLEQVMLLRRHFSDTVAQLDREVSPLMARRTA